MPTDLASYLRMPSPGRSQLAQQLLLQSQQPRAYSTAGMLNIAAKPILGALLARRENIARQQQQGQNRQLLEQLLGGGGERNSALAGILAQNPQAMSQFALGQLGTNENSPFGKVNPKDYTPESVSEFQRTNDFSVLRAAQEPGKGPNIPDLINQVSDDLYKESTDFVIQRDAVGRIQAAAQDPSAAGDIALVFSFMKAQDPNSVVRESEYATAENARGVPATIRNIYNRVLSGERLADEQRQDFVNKSLKIFEQSKRDQDQRNQRFLKRAISSGIPEQTFKPLLIPLVPMGAPVQQQVTTATPTVSSGPARVIR